MFLLPGCLVYQKAESSAQQQTGPHKVYATSLPFTEKRQKYLCGLLIKLHTSLPSSPVLFIRGLVPNASKTNFDVYKLLRLGLQMENHVDVWQL